MAPDGLLQIDGFRGFEKEDVRDNPVPFLCCRVLCVDCRQVGNHGSQCFYKGFGLVCVRTRWRYFDASPNDHAITNIRVADSSDTIINRVMIYREEQHGIHLGRH